MPTVTGPLPAYLLGRHLNSVSVATCTVSTGGVFTVASASSSTSQVGDLHTSKVLDGMKINVTNRGEGITPADVRQANNVTTESDFSITLTEILSLASPSFLMTASFVADYIRIYKEIPSTISGTSTPICFCVIARVGEAVENYAKGKNTVEMTVDSAGLAPYYGPVSGLTF